jgi:hypothetical protein
MQNSAGRLRWQAHEYVIMLNNTVHAPKGGAARAAVITQSPEVKTTKRTQPRSHGKQANTKKHSHDTQSICL